MGKMFAIERAKKAGCAFESSLLADSDKPFVLAILPRHTLEHEVGCYRWWCWPSPI